MPAIAGLAQLALVELNVVRHLLHDLDHCLGVQLLFLLDHPLQPLLVVLGYLQGVLQGALGLGTGRSLQGSAQAKAEQQG